MAKSITYTCKIDGDGSAMSALPVPFDPRQVFGKIRAPIVVQIGDFSYRSTIAAMGGPLFIPFRKSNREAAGVEIGQEIDVTLTLDEAPRTVELPDDLEAAIKAMPGGLEAWDKASYTHRREYVEAINEAKRPETREKRVGLALDFVRSRLNSRYWRSRMTHKGSCHCGGVNVVIADDPADATECNCSICRRTGALWTYASPSRVQVTGEGVPYMHGDKFLSLFHCPTCGVITHWTAIDPAYDKMGINLRLFEPDLWESLPRTFADGASY